MPIDIRFPLDDHPVSVDIRQAIDELDSKIEVPWIHQNLHMTLVHSNQEPTIEQKKKILEITQSVLAKYEAFPFSIALQCDSPFVTEFIEVPIDFGAKRSYGKLHVQDSGFRVLQEELTQSLRM